MEPHKALEETPQRPLRTPVRSKCPWRAYPLEPSNAKQSALMQSGRCIWPEVFSGDRLAWLQGLN